MRIQKPDYQRSIASLACSVLKHFGIEPPNPTLPEADALLGTGYQNVVVLLLDGMGVNVLEKHLSVEGFFRRNLHCTYSSTFPPTTVAATTAVTSGLYPNQSAWLGWRGYFPAIDRNVVYFLNTDYDTQEKITDCHVAGTFVPYRDLAGQIRQAGAEAYGICSWLSPFPKTYRAVCDEIARLCAAEGRKYIYAYWEQPDSAMHSKGIDDAHITSLLADIERETEALVSGLNDTLVLVTADHGMINSRSVLLEDYPNITECLVRMPSIEPRALNLFVKPECQAQFVQAFNRHFGGSFLLLSKQEVFSRGLFGTGNDHPQLDGMLGDFLAVATGDLAIRTHPKHYLGEHAGMTPEEMTIPLIAFEKA